jgi:hypothetical protein
MWIALAIVAGITFVCAGLCLVAVLAAPSLEEMDTEYMS